MAIPTIAQVTKVSIEGDSITSQCTTGTTIYNAIGWVNSLNALSGNRFPYVISQNFAVGGGTIVDMDSTKVTQLGTATGEMIFLLAGTNDWAASTSLATIQAALTSIKNYVLNTLQKRLCVVGLMPRTQTGGTPMGSTLIATARSYNAWLVAQRDVANGFHVVDPYDALCTVGTDEPNPTYFKDESSKLLHPNTAGSLVLGQTVWTQLKIDGFSGTDAPQVGSPNLFAYGSMSGSGGTATSPATGTVATGITVTGSGGSQARTCTVSNGQRVQFAPSSGDGAAVNFKVTASTNVTGARGYSVGDTVRGWALISTGTLNLCDGPWLQLSDVGSTTTTYYGYNHGGNTTGYFPSDQKFILMTTPSFAVASGNTGLKPEVVCQLNATGAGAVADVIVHSMGIINETTARAVSTTDLRGILLPNVNPTPPVAVFDGDWVNGDWVPSGGGGEFFTITGSGFGTLTGAAYSDDFEARTVGALGSSSLSPLIISDVTGGSISTSVKHSGTRALVQDYGVVGAGLPKHYKELSGTSKRIRLSCKILLTGSWSGGGYSDAPKMKFGRCGAGVPYFGYPSMKSNCTTQATFVDEPVFANMEMYDDQGVNVGYAPDHNISPVSPPDAWTNGTWQQYEIAYDFGDIDTSNAKFTEKLDNKLTINSATKILRTTIGGGALPAWCMTPMDGMVDAVPLSTLKLAIDNFHINEFFNRVIMGDHATYASANFLKLHELSVVGASWSDTSITIPKSYGQFVPGDTVYLYVFNSEGTLVHTTSSFTLV